MSSGEILAIIGGWSVLLIGVSAWISRLVTERVRSQWRRDEQRTLETQRGGLAGDRILLEAAITSYSSGQNLFQQRRLSAVERLWDSVLGLRESFSGPVFFFGILLPSEYDSAIEKGGPLVASIADISDATINSVIKQSFQVESDRPHLGETLWFQFFIYRAFLGRLAILVSQGKEQGHIIDWHDDTVVRQLLGAVLPDNWFAAHLNSKNDLSSLNKVINMLEGLILKEISLITSGQRSSSESFENAEGLREALSGLKTTQS